MNGKVDVFMKEALPPLFKTVLESGFHYVGVELDIKPVLKIADVRQEATNRPWIAAAQIAAAQNHKTQSGNQGTGTPINDVEVWFTLPSIETWCAQCKDTTHHESHSHLFAIHYVVKESAGHQTFIIQYQCRKCKGPELTFLVRRDIFKVRLAGRSIAYYQKPPPEIPEKLRDIYSDAIQAAACKDFSAAFYHWRTLMEHAMKSTLGMPFAQEVRGDDLSKKYNAGIDPRVRDNAPLAEMMSLCSQHLHARTDDKEKENAYKADFQSVRERIEAHFQLIATLRNLPQLARDATVTDETTLNQRIVDFVRKFFQRRG
jgi:hypothetical protein